jgi:hypothetical protein
VLSTSKSLDELLPQAQHQPEVHPAVAANCEQLSMAPIDREISLEAAPCSGTATPTNNQLRSQHQQHSVLAQSCLLHCCIRSMTCMHASHNR